MSQKEIIENDITELMIYPSLNPKLRYYFHHQMYVMIGQCGGLALEESPVMQMFEEEDPMYKQNMMLATLMVKNFVKYGVACIEWCPAVKSVTR